MARFSDYIDTGYLPGEVYSSGLDAYSLFPQLKADYLSSKRFKFQPKDDTDSGERFQTFLALQQNPEALMSKDMQLPIGFVNNLKMFSEQ